MNAQHLMAGMLLSLCPLLAHAQHASSSNAYPPTGAATQGQYQANSTSSAQYQTQQGKLTVNTSQPGPANFGPPPAFSQLAHGSAGFITPDQAVAYPPLANDFIYADSNRDGRVSRSEYKRWAAQQ